MYGAGATGCTIGSRLFAAGEDVCLIARGENLARLKQDGLKMTTQHGQETYKIPSFDIAELDEKQDVIILATKGYNVIEIAPNLQKLMHDDTVIIPSSNGIPWWFFYGQEGPMKDYRLKSVDSAKIDEYINCNNVIGGTCYMSASQIGPAEVASMAHVGFNIGEIDHSKSDRLTKLAAILEKAGFKKPVTSSIHRKIWWKLCWNVPFNPLSVITGKNSQELINDQKCWNRAYKMAEEVIKLSDALNTPLEIDINQIIGFDVGPHKPSMLQDFEKGKQLEIQEILGAVCEIGQHLGVDIPTIDDVYDELIEVVESNKKIKKM